VGWGCAFRIKRFWSPHTTLICWSQTEVQCGRLCVRKWRMFERYSPVCTRENLDGSFGIVTRYGLKGAGFESRHRWEIFIFPETYSPALGPTHPSMQLLRGFFPEGGRGKKQPGREADHSRLSSAEVRNEWSYTSAVPTYLHGLCRNNFTFLTYP